MFFDRFVVDFRGRKSIKNQSKIDPKGDRKQDGSWDGFWMALGLIFGGLCAHVGGQVGAKLAPKSEEMGYQDDVKKSSKIWRRKGTARTDVLAPNIITILTILTILTISLCTTCLASLIMWLSHIWPTLRSFT